jgi:CxxH/CxxC protein (TIGR04129 family)
VYIVCAEHLEEALDNFVETYDAPPDVHLLEEVSFTAWTAPAVCEYCKNTPKYLVI